MNQKLLQQLTRQQLQQIDTVASQFESKLIAGQQPKIETAVQSVGEELGAPLLAELISTEADFLRSIGAAPTEQSYILRFPDHSQIVSTLFHGKDESTDAAADAKIDAAATGRMSTDDTDSFVQSISAAAAADTRADQTTANPQDVAISKQFGRYRIERVLGAGGMGTVYLAEDTQLERRVALKIPKFSASDNNGGERFLREARAMAMVEHPNLCPMHDVGEIDGRQFLTMTYVDGPTLVEVLQQDGPFPTDNAVRLMTKLAEAVQVAHDAGIVHRDLKPANIMINQRNEPIIMDFGLARREEATSDTITQEGMIIGSPAYMAPEQVEAKVKAIGPKTDLYALGVILYELLSGQRPYQGSPLSVLAQIKVGNPVPLKERSPATNSQLAAICTKAMASNAAERYASGERLATALADFTVGQDRPLRIFGNWTIAAAACVLVAVCSAVYVLETPKGTVTVTAPDLAEVDLTVRNGDEVVAFHATPNTATARAIVDSTASAPRPSPWENTFVDSGLRFHSVYSTSVAAGDLDGDGRPDAVVGTNNSSNITIYWNEGPGNFVTGELTPDVTLGHAGNTALSDLDGDGDLDIFLARSNGAPDRVLLNKGHRTFVVTKDLLSKTPSAAVAINDLDGDNDPDVWVTGVHGRHSVWLNDGTGRFSKGQLSLPITVAPIPSILLADFDADGDVDAFTKFQNKSGELEAYFCWNDGFANFTLSEPVAGTRGIGRNVACDFDKDGRIDIAAIADGGKLTFLRNRQDGWVVEQISEFNHISAWRFVAQDFNGDASPDLAIAIKGKQASALDLRNIVWFNDGSGQFSAHARVPGPGPTLGLAAADFDLDGDLDLFEANAKDVPDRILWNESKR